MKARIRIFLSRKLLASRRFTRQSNGRRPTPRSCFAARGRESSTQKEKPPPSHCYPSTVITNKVNKQTGQKDDCPHTSNDRTSSTSL